MVISEIVTFVFYGLSMALLPEYFGESAVSTGTSRSSSPLTLETSVCFAQISRLSSRPGSRGRSHSLSPSGPFHVASDICVAMGPLF